MKNKKNNNGVNKFDATKEEMTSSLGVSDQMTSSANNGYYLVNCGEGPCTCTPETCTCPSAKKRAKKAENKNDNRFE